MACPELEDLLCEGPGGHAAHCAECAALLEAYEDAEAALTAAFEGVAAPPSLLAGARQRVAGLAAERPPTALPELLDFVGWAAVLTLFATQAPRLAPLVAAALGN